MTNRYYQLSSKEKRRFQLKLALISLSVILVVGIIIVAISVKAAFLIVFVIATVISIIAPFYDVPGLIENGKLKYYSLFLLAEQEKNGLVKIHGGTLFDYYFTFKKEMTSQERTKLVLLEFLKGVRNLANEKNEEVKIQGTSYIVNERTASKVGLKKINTDLAQKFILLFNYVNLMISISFVKKAIHFPNLNNVKTFQGEVSDVKANKDYLDRLIEKLEKQLITSNRY